MMSSKYNELKAFTLNYSGVPPVVNVYLCRGIACDEVSKWARRYRDEANIEENQILFYNEPPKKGDKLYRRIDWVNGEETGKVTAWYLTDEEAIMAAEVLQFRPSAVIDGKKYYAYQVGYLNTEVIEPLQQIEITFALNSKGRLYTRANMHPEWNGERVSGGKIFFPDKSFTTADIGRAIVSVSKEFDNFGFLIGEMIKVKDVPKMNDILDWAWKNRDPHEELVTINHPGRGRYFAIYDGEYYQQILQMNLFGEEAPHIYVSEYDMFQTEHDVKNHEECRATFFQLFAKDAWGKVISMDELDAMFKESKFFEETDAPGIDWWKESIKYHSDIITKAVNAGILTQYKMPVLNIEVVTFNWVLNNVLGLLNYPLEEVEQIATEMSNINTKADAIAEKARGTGKFIW